MAPRTSFANTLDAILHIFRSAFRPLMLTAALFQSLSFAYLLIVTHLGLAPDALGLANAIPALVTVWAFAALVALADDVHGQRPLARPALYYRRVLPKLAQLVGSALAFYAFEVLGLVLFVVPGVWLGVAHSLTLPVVTLETRGFFAAFTRARRLARGGFWRLLGVEVVSLALLIVVPGLLEGPFIAGALTTGLVDTSPLFLLWSTAVGTLTLPLVPVTLTVLYHQRTDAWANPPGDPAPEARPVEGAGPPGP